MDRVDGQIESPSSRALRIYSQLRSNARDVNDWDMICFSVEFLARMSQSYPWLEELVKPLTRIVYVAHYNGFFSEDNETLKRDTESGRKVFLSGSGRSSKASNSREEDSSKERNKQEKET